MYAYHQPTRRLYITPVNTPAQSRHPALQHRSAGLLLHFTSLPSGHGTGDLGPQSRRFINLLSHARIRWWQTLPVHPPVAHAWPYSADSTHAGNPLLISLDDLHRDGLLQKSDLPTQKFPEGKLRHDPALHLKRTAIATAFSRFQSARSPQLHEQFEKFSIEESPWLDDYALFATLRRHLPAPHWQDWPRPLAHRHPAALASARKKFHEQIQQERFTQFLFFRQFAALRQYAQAHAVQILGDLPLFVSNDSADLWTHPPLFKLDRHLRPRAHAGTPPDYFCPTGQNWGNPVYNWNAMHRDNYRWWIARFRAAMRFCDVVRIDHFRGFAAAWEIPTNAKNSSHGKWIPGPGAKLFNTLKEKSPTLACVVEDLGVITDDVTQLRDQFHLLGMRVLQFGFDHLNIHSPPNIPEPCIVYTGTHDNNTTNGWYRTLPRKTKHNLHLLAPDANHSAAHALIRLAWLSPARIAITPMQDLLNLGSKARMNTPGQPAGNWSWRLKPNDLKTDALPWLARLTKATARSHSGADAPVG